MAGPLSYEPSVEAIIAELLSSSIHALGGLRGLRRRVSRCLLARATGLGQIEGGEMVLVPSGRSSPVVAHLEELERAGVAGVLFVDDVAIPADVHIAVLKVPAATDLRQFEAAIERYIARRRRELFALEQELHRSLTEAAIGGANVTDLLAWSAHRSGKPAVLDRDGLVAVVPEGAPSLSDALLLRARIACHGPRRGTVRIDGTPGAVAAPVVTGNERRGIALLICTGALTPDEDEAIVASLASACAIALGRVPERTVPDLHHVLQDLHTIAQDWNTSIALAVKDSSSTVAQIERAVSAELSVRGVNYVCGTDGDVVVAIAGAGETVPWDAVLSAIGARLGIADLPGGLSREHAGSGKAALAAAEALNALRHGNPGAITRFGEIELVSLVAGDQKWVDFARARLGPLLDGTEGRTELLATLRAYLASGHNAKEAARVLHVHRNTLLYRLRRLQDVLGIDMSDSNSLFELDLAARVLDITARRT